MFPALPVVVLGVEWALIDGVLEGFGSDVAVALLHVARRVAGCGSPMCGFPADHLHRCNVFCWGVGRQVATSTRSKVSTCLLASMPLQIVGNLPSANLVPPHLQLLQVIRRHLFIIVSFT